MFGKYERAGGYDIEWLPWYVIAWRMLWIIPLMAARFMFVGIVLCMRGPQMAERMWEETA